MSSQAPPLDLQKQTDPSIGPGGSLRLFLEMHPDPVFIHVEGRIVFANRSATSFLSLASIAEAVGMPLDDFILPEHRAPFKERLQNAISSGQAPPITELIFVAGDGKRKWAEETSYPVNFDGLDSLVTFARDVSKRKKTEENLLRSREIYDKLLAAIPDMVVQMDENGRILYVNEIALELSGYRREEIEGNSMLQFIVPEEHQRAAENLALMIKGRLGPREYHLIMKDGSRVLFEVNGDILREEDGTPFGIVNVCRDLSRRRKTEEALRESEERFRLIANNLPNAMVYQIHVEPDGTRRFTYVSGNIERLNKVSVEEVLADGRVLYNQVHPENRADLIARENDALREMSGFRYETRFILPSGEVRWFDLASTPRSLSDGRIVWDGVEVDITDRKANEEKIRQSETRFRANFEHAPVGMAIIDTQMRFIEVNSQMCKILGYEAEEMAGRSFNEFTHPEDRSGGRERWRQLLEGEVDFNHAEKRYLHRDGRVLWVLVSNTLVRTEHGEPLYFISHLVDITAQKKALEEKARLEIQLRQAQKMEAIGTLAGGIAHDFNNILTAIMGYGELAHEELRESGHDTYSIDQIIKAAERARDLVRQILTFSRKHKAELRPVDLNQVVAYSVKMLEHSIPKMIDIQMKLAGNLDSVLADANQIEQVIMNLGGNASDAMPDGGRLVFETKSVILDEAFCDTHFEVASGRYVQLSVSDTGHGMDKEILTRIFDPFFTTKEVGKGTGLGLSTVYGIVKEHGGYITCDSQPGAGTVFAIYLPSHLGEVDLPGAPEPSSKAEAGGKELVLLVDDEEAVMDVGSQILRGAGYRVLTARSGEEALDVLRQHGGEVDLVVLDLGMPGMGGHKCLGRLLASDPEAKILITTGYSLDKRVRETLSSGASGYIAKPFRRADFLATVQRVLSGRVSETSSS